MRRLNSRWYILVLALTSLLLAGSMQPRTLQEKLQDAALAQPRAWYAPNTDTPGAHETDEQYEQRIRVGTRALADATMRERKDGTYAVVPPDWRWHRKVLVVAVLAHWYEESRLAYEVHAGIDHPVWDQDKGLARCFGQLHVGLVPSRTWEQLAGLDEKSTKLCALWTARALTRMAHYCAGRRARHINVNDMLLPMFSAMGGSGCSPTVSGRAKTARFAKMWQEVQRR